ncbi:enterotoxin [Edaphobacter sp. HDX4]|uniref:enterotoxin n=1 Tax=Edaphobacter sp. HDX4 TaxID=2794064 RepID=UPI002FE50807
MRGGTAGLLVLVVGSCLSAQTQDGGKAQIEGAAGNLVLGNRVIAARCSASEQGLHVEVKDLRKNRTLQMEGPLSVLFADGSIVRGDQMHIVERPVAEDLKPDPSASRQSEHFAGREIHAVLEDEQTGLRVRWTLELRDGSTYIREVFTLQAPKQDLAMRRVRLVDVRPTPAALTSLRVVGTVNGSPLAVEDFFLGFEHPLSESRVVRGEGIAELERTLPLLKDQSITYSSVIGVVQPTQLRRDFLTYLERERAHPYRTFLHYNSWYDMGYFTPYDQTMALGRVHTFGEELHVKRGVKMDSFLFDDGWDDHASLWSFNKGFPDGFVPIREAASKYEFAPGVWMSPWGGYSKPKQERIKFGEAQGFEIVGGGFALSGSKYYQRFRDVCLKMIREQGVNQFKFDGTGNVNHVVPGSRFDSDFDAMIHLIGELREAKPDIYINLTTGTTASPFWLRYADSIWRGGEDDALAGVGTKRERWITYRDAQTYERVVARGPLFPLNSLMLHGIIYARYDKRLNDDPGDDFADEVRSYFGTGTQLQEMYLTPELLSKKNWDVLAEAARWSRDNADVLKDTHWVGGDPEWLQVYGWASWSKEKSILVLRNPSDKPQDLALDIGSVLELPVGAARRFHARSPWREDAAQPTFSLAEGTPHRFALKPFQVLTLELQPER